MREGENRLKEYVELVSSSGTSKAAKYGELKRSDYSVR
jgi:hypothetical protein